jgi:translation initiation factor 2 beta subunit (eIF-2beta)/eIF-5
MDASQVAQAFRWIEQFRHTPCRECRSRQTFPLIYEGVVIVSCEDCGGSTPKGRLTKRTPTTA